MYRRKLAPLYTLLALFVLAGGLAALGYSFVNLDYDWQFAFLMDYLWLADVGQPGLVLKGLWGTIYISVASIVLGTAMGVLVGLAQLSPEPVTCKVSHLYVDIFRNTPVLVQLYVVYFIVGTALDLSPEAAGILTLSLFCSAYVAEILRGTVQEFDKGQLDAGRSMGLSPLQISVSIVGPQVLRKMLPALVGQFVSLVKDSSLVSVISVTDLTKSALNVVSVSFRSFETWFVIAVMYFALNYVLSSYGRYLEKKLRVDYGHC